MNQGDRASCLDAVRRATDQLGQTGRDPPSAMVSSGSRDVAHRTWHKGILSPFPMSVED